MKKSMATEPYNQRLQAGQQSCNEEVMLMEVKGKKQPEGGDVWKDREGNMRIPEERGQGQSEALTKANSSTHVLSPSTQNHAYYVPALFLVLGTQK